MAMVYGDLLKVLLHATKEELAQNVTVFEPGLGEFYPIASEPRVSGEAKDCPADGILDDGHLFLEILFVPGEFVSGD